MTGVARKDGFLQKVRKLSFNQKLGLLLTFVSVAVSVASCLVSVIALKLSADSRDIRDAIRNLSELASQTKRQADNSEAQLDTLRIQADAARAQTDAISQQTSAIEASSAANVKSATAQTRMADSTTKAQIPSIDLQELSISGIRNPEIEDDKSHIWVNLFWRFRNTGGSALTTDSVEYGLWVGKELPNEFPHGNLVPGQDTVVTPTINSAFSPLNPIPLKIDSAAQKAVLSGKFNLFFFARYKFKDRQGDSHVRCFGRLFIGDGTTTWANSIPSGGSAYRCVA